MDILVHRKHNKLFYKEEHGTTTCDRKKCTLCKHMKSSEHFSDESGNIYATKGNISCTTENVVYGVFCQKCQKLMYIGETMNSLYQRHV